MRVVVLGMCVCVCVCVCLPILAYMSEVRHHRVLCRLLKICIVWTSLKTLCIGDMALFACHDDQ